MTSRREFFMSTIAAVVGGIPWLGEKLKADRWNITVKKDLVPSGGGPYLFADPKHLYPGRIETVGDPYLFTDPSYNTALGVPFRITHEFSLLDESGNPLTIRFGVSRYDGERRPTRPVPGSITGFIDIVGHHYGGFYGFLGDLSWGEFELDYTEHARMMRDRLVILCERLDTSEMTKVNGSLAVTTVVSAARTLSQEIQLQFVPGTSARLPSKREQGASR